MWPKITQNWKYTRTALMTLWLLTTCSSNPGRIFAHSENKGFDSYQTQESEAADLQTNPPQNVNDDTNPWYSTEVEKRKLKLMLGASIIIIAGFVVAVLLMCFLRMGRLRRQRALSGKKPQPTEYSDAWSQYRLKDGWENELPDELGSSGKNVE
jgi:hypothetical protein